jgi:hypothetical protein
MMEIQVLGKDEGWGVICKGRSQKEANQDK